METMCAILAAVAHDLDHPGVNQHFLIATNSHLASLYNNLSVLESHHWRFAISCLKESHVFDHFNPAEWTTIRHLLKSLILATDITQQASYLAQFRIVMSSLRERRKSSNKTDQELFQEADIELEQELRSQVSIHEVGDSEEEAKDAEREEGTREAKDAEREEGTRDEAIQSSSQSVSKPSTSSYPSFSSSKVFNMKLPESRLFILTIALKCADLGNPCRPWDLSKRWSEQICAEFYRQGDFERSLDLPVTPICNRYQASMAKIQTGQLQHHIPFSFLSILSLYLLFTRLPVFFSSSIFLSFCIPFMPSFYFVNFLLSLFSAPNDLFLPSLFTFKFYSLTFPSLPRSFSCSLFSFLLFQ